MTSTILAFVIHMLETCKPYYKCINFHSTYGELSNCGPFSNSGIGGKTIALAGLARFGLHQPVHSVLYSIPKLLNLNLWPNDSQIFPISASALRFFPMIEKYAARKTATKGKKKITGLSSLRFFPKVLHRDMKIPTRTRIKMYATMRYLIPTFSPYTCGSSSEEMLFQSISSMAPSSSPAGTGRL